MLYLHGGFELAHFNLSYLLSVSMREEYEFNDGLQYSDEVLNAVRYGYQYRLEAEKYCQEKKIHVNHCLEDAPALLCWIVKLIIDGVAWDSLKKTARSVVEHFQREKRTIPPMVNEILTDQQSFQQLYEYIKEFKEGKMNISDREREYIIEEIEADYCEKQAAKIYEAEKRFPTVEEYKRIYRDAHEAAMMILPLRERHSINEDVSSER